MLDHLAKITKAKSGRCSSWQRNGRNADWWNIPAGESRVLADIEGPGRITHLWMTQPAGYRECLLRITWDDAKSPSVNVPLGDFFCLGNGIVNSFESMPFTVSTNSNNQFNAGCAMNCYLPMPFAKRAKVELVNQGKENQMQFFYVDYETFESEPEEMAGYFHAEFRRANPFGGWGHEVAVNTAEANVVNKERVAWDNNYVILDTKGCGHYIGCNLSVTNLQGTWWGEGDDMIWVDGYKWPPDLHGTGSEDYLNQAWGMQDNAYLRNGSSIYEPNTLPPTAGHTGGYQTSYVFHLENPVRFTKEIKVTIEHGHGNHLANEMASVAYWYAARPRRVVRPPSVARRMPILKDSQGNWLIDPKNRCPGEKVRLTDEMRRMKAKWAKQHGKA